MKELYFSLRKKLSDHIVIIYFIVFVAFVTCSSISEKTIYGSGIAAIVLFAILILLSQYQYLNRNCFLLSIFILYNPILDDSISSFNLAFKIIVYILLFLLFSKYLSKNIKIILFANCVFLIFHCTLTLNKSQLIYQETKSNLSQFILNKINKNQSVDVIILDAYPDFQIIQDSLHQKSQFKPFLINQKFNIISNTTYSTKTPISLANLFFDKSITPNDIGIEFKDRIQYQYEIINQSKLKKQCKKQNIDFQLLSPTNISFNENIWELYWNYSNTRYFGSFSRLMNNLPKFIFGIQNFYKADFDLESDLTFQKIDQYNNQVLKEFENKSHSTEIHVRIYHFLTLHKYNPQNPSNAFKNDLKRADDLGIYLVQSLIKNQNSNIIVLSDHGNRTLIKNIENQKRGILAIKELK